MNRRIRKKQKTVACKKFLKGFKQSLIQMKLMRLGIIPENSCEDFKKELEERKNTNVS